MSINVKPSDATTQLNIGTAGDLMDETGLTYINQDTQVTTTRKRPRVVLGGDAGELVSVNTNPAEVNVATADGAVADLLRELTLHMQMQTGLLRALASELGAEISEDDAMAMGDIHK